MKITVILTGALLTHTAFAQVQRLDALSGEPITINPLAPPTGIQLFQVLIENAAMPLQGTGCIDERPTSLTLQHQLALMLGYGLGVKQNKVNLKAKCESGPFETSDGIIDAWSCEVNVIETTKRGTYISNASTRVGLTKDTWQIVPGSLLCL
jgi:hypothetical protein